MQAAAPRLSRVQILILAYRMLIVDQTLHHGYFVLRFQMPF